MNANKERYCNMIYNVVLSYIKSIVGNKTTYSDDLLTVSKKLLGDKFIGVYASDEIPKLKNDTYAILNLDKSSEPGSHWIAIYKNEQETYVYDSFGRKNQKIIPSLTNSGNGIIKDTDHDAEQKINEIDCGARSLAWILFCDIWGIACAKLI